jgi:hypothetical protein
MKRTVFAAAVAVSAGLASASVYSDATGENFLSDGHMDIASVTLTNDATNLYIEVQTGAALIDGSNNWGKYVFGINNGQGGPSTGSNGWGRNISFGGQEITHWLGSWADASGPGSAASGAELRSWNGSDWGTIVDATYLGGGLVSSSNAGYASGKQVLTIALSALGVGIGDTITFDAMTTAGGGGDPGVDHLSRADQSTPFWDTQSVSGSFLSYTIVPTPGSFALLGLGGLAAARRRR